MRGTVTLILLAGLWIVFALAVQRGDLPWPFLLAGALFGSAVIVGLVLARDHARPVYQRGREERGGGNGGGD